MTRAELLALKANLESAYQRCVQLGGYSADADIIKFLTGNLFDVAEHLIQVDKNIARLKRVPKKKKK